MLSSTPVFWCNALIAFCMPVAYVVVNVFLYFYLLMLSVSCLLVLYVILYLLLVGVCYLIPEFVGIVQDFVHFLLMLLILLPF